jgi:hypothetical protein
MAMKLQNARSVSHRQQDGMVYTANANGLRLLGGRHGGSGLWLILLWVFVTDVCKKM